MFFIFSLIGYIWEVSLQLVQTGELVNKGTMYGPWLPIYGSGGILVYLLLKRFKHKPILIFILSLLICTSMEYLISYFLEITKGLRWWDYSTYLINLNGRVCLEGAIIFGIAGCIVMYIAGPFFTKCFNKIPYILQIIICLFLVISFTLDFVYSHHHPNMGEGITYSETIE